MNIDDRADDEHLVYFWQHSHFHFHFEHYYITGKMTNMMSRVATHASLLLSICLTFTFTLNNKHDREDGADDE